MSTSKTQAGGDPGLPDLFQVAAKQWRLISGFALAFLIIAVIGTVVRQPTYEATAYLEVADEADIATIQDRLRFPLLYQGIDEDPGAAQALANRVRVRASRGSRIISVTVSHNEPSIAAEEANAIVDAFIGDELDQNAKLDALRKQLEAVLALPHLEDADSPETLADLWRDQKAEVEKLADQYTGDHPVISGARERTKILEQRMSDQFSEIREDLGLPKAEDVEFSKQVEQLLSEMGAAREKGDQLSSELQRLTNRPGRGAGNIMIVERATLPLQPAGVPSALIWLGALALGIFAGFLIALCRPA